MDVHIISEDKGAKMNEMGSTLRKPLALPIQGRRFQGLNKVQ